MFTGDLLTGLKTALVGKKLGSRILAVVPPKDGFGANATSEGIGATDTLVFVVDMNQIFPQPDQQAGPAPAAGRCR